MARRLTLPSEASYHMSRMACSQSPHPSLHEEDLHHQLIVALSHY